MGFKMVALKCHWGCTSVKGQHFVVMDLM